MSEKIIQVSGFGVANTPTTQCDYMLAGLTSAGRVIISVGDGRWTDVTGDSNRIQSLEGAICGLAEKLPEEWNSEGPVAKEYAACRSLARRYRAEILDLLENDDA
jgi:hypothetical protein